MPFSRPNPQARPRRLEPVLPLAALLLAGAVSLAAFLGLNESPLPEQAVLVSVEQAVAKL